VKVRSLVQELRQRGHQLTVLTPNLGLDARHSFGIHAQRCRWGWQSDENGVRAVYLSSWFRHRSLTLNPDVIGFCIESLADFDIVHFYGLYDLLGPLVGKFCRKRQIPYVIEPMGMFRPIDRSFRKKRLWQRTLGRSFWHGAARVIATSELEAQDLIDLGVPIEKVIIRHNGVDASLADQLPSRIEFRCRHSISSSEPVLVLLSRLIPRKGADLLIQAFASACPDDGRLVIAGPEGQPGYRSYLEKCARESGVGNRVLFTGPLYDSEKKSVLAAADIFVLPSAYENFANVVAEAISCGVPAIISRFCGIHSLVDGRAGLVVDREPAALASAINALLHDPSLYARLKAGCRVVTEQLSWNQLAAKMEGYYEGVLAETRPSA
jgi:teichuronic acid biosynthesis glycosyltransferase TuaC